MKLQISYQEILALAQKQITTISVVGLEYVGKATVCVSAKKKLIGSIYSPVISKNIRILEVYNDTVIVEMIDTGFLLKMVGCLLKNDIMTIAGNKITICLGKIEKLHKVFNLVELKDVIFNESRVEIEAEALLPLNY